MTDSPKRRLTDMLLPHPGYEPCPGGCKDLEKVAVVVSKTEIELQHFELRLKESHDQLTRFEARLTEGDARMGRIETLITKNSSAMLQNTSDTSEILQIMRETKSAFVLIGRLGTAVKWLSGMVIALGGVWLIFKDLRK